MPRLSIIIPALGQIDLLEEGLVSVLQHRPTDSEVIVALDRAYDDPYNLRDEDVRFVELAAGASRLACLNRGLAVAQGEIVHVLACGAEATPHWADAAMARFDDPQVGAVAPLVLDTSGDAPCILLAGLCYTLAGDVRPVARGKRFEKFDCSSVVMTGPSAVAAFYRAAAIERLDVAFDVALGDELAEIDLPLRIRSRGLRSVLEPDSIVQARPTMLVREPRGFARSRHAERLFWRHAADHPWLSRHGAHALAVAGELLHGLFHGQIKAVAQGRLRGAVDALTSRLTPPPRQAIQQQPAPEAAKPAAESPESLRIDAARREAAKRKKAAAPRQLKRSA